MQTHYTVYFEHINGALTSLRLSFSSLSDIFINLSDRAPVLCFSTWPTSSSVLYLTPTHASGLCTISIRRFTSICYSIVYYRVRLLYLPQFLTVSSTFVAQSTPLSAVPSETSTDQCFLPQEVPKLWVANTILNGLQYCTGHLKKYFSKWSSFILEIYLPVICPLFQNQSSNSIASNQIERIVYDSHWAVGSMMI